MMAETVTVTLVRLFDAWQVFGNYEGPEDRYTFGVRTFPVAMRAEAEKYAARLRAEAAGRKVVTGVAE